MNSLKHFGLVTLNIPEAAETSGVILKFHQEKHGGSAFDQCIEYAILESTTPGSGQVPKQLAGIKDDDRYWSQWKLWNYYRTIQNGILDYGQLRPGFFKFGDLKITGGDRAC